MNTDEINDSHFVDSLVLHDSESPVGHVQPEAGHEVSESGRSKKQHQQKRECTVSVEPRTEEAAG